MTTVSRAKIVCREPNTSIRIDGDVLLNLIIRLWCRTIADVIGNDIDIDTLPRYGLNYDSYMPDTASLAQFIKSAVDDDFDIICQCDYGQSRSAACAAAILEYYEIRYYHLCGLSILSQSACFNKVLNALRETNM